MQTKPTSDVDLWLGDVKYNRTALNVALEKKTRKYHQKNRTILGDDG